MKMKKPAGANRRGFDIHQVSRKDIDTAVPLDFQPEFAPVAWLAARAGVHVSTARVHAELFGIGGRL